MRRTTAISLLSLTMVLSAAVSSRAQVGLPGPPDEPGGTTARPSTPLPPITNAPLVPAPIVTAPIAPAVPPATAPVPLDPRLTPPLTQSLPARPARTPSWEPPSNSPGPLAAPRYPLISVFETPAGLSRPLEDILAEINVVPVRSFPLTPQTTFDVAYACYIRDDFRNAVALADHGLKMCNDARLHLLKGVCLLYLGNLSGAEQTAARFRIALAQNQFFGLDIARERINDPMRVRFDNIVEYQSTGH